MKNYLRPHMGGEGKEEFSGSDVDDILNLFPFLSHIDKADTSRIGIYGWSRGTVNPSIARGPQETYAINYNAGGANYSYDPIIKINL